MRCAFCELGGEQFGRNLTPQELRDQVTLVLEEAARYGFDINATPHKMNVAGSGEPLLNRSLVDGFRLIGDLPQTIKISTVFPDDVRAWVNFQRVVDFAAELTTQVIQIQISLISTSEEERQRMSGGRVASFAKLRDAAALWRTKNPQGRKVNLSLIITGDDCCAANEVRDLFPPELFRFRFREYVPTRHGTENHLSSATAERLAAINADFAAAGYEVGDWASPTPIERKFGLASNAIRQRYLEMTRPR